MNKRSELVSVVVIVHERRKLSLAVSANGDPQKLQFIPLSEIRGEELIRAHTYGEEVSLTLPLWLADEKRLLPEGTDAHTLDMFGKT